MLLFFPPKVTKPGTLLLGSTISDNLRFQNEICALTRVLPQIQFEVKTLGVSRDANRGAKRSVKRSFPKWSRV